MHWRISERREYTFCFRQSEIADENWYRWVLVHYICHQKILTVTGFKQTPRQVELRMKLIHFLEQKYPGYLKWKWCDIDFSPDLQIATASFKVVIWKVKCTTPILEPLNSSRQPFVPKLSLQKGRRNIPIWKINRSINKTK